LNVFLFGLALTVLLAWVFLRRVERKVDEPVE
jgi:peptidoglycan/LPS O-acetylase OafA/YrhL